MLEVDDGVEGGSGEAAGTDLLSRSASNSPCLAPSIGDCALGLEPDSDGLAVSAGEGFHCILGGGSDCSRAADRFKVLSRVVAARSLILPTEEAGFSLMVSMCRKSRPWPLRAMVSVSYPALGRARN